MSDKKFEMHTTGPWRLFCPGYLDNPPYDSNSSWLFSPGACIHEEVPPPVNNVLGVWFRTCKANRRDDKQKLPMNLHVEAEFPICEMRAEDRKRLATDVRRGYTFRSEDHPLGGLALLLSVNGIPGRPLSVASLGKCNFCLMLPRGVMVEAVRRVMSAVTTAGFLRDGVNMPVMFRHVTSLSPAIGGVTDGSMVMAFVTTSSTGVNGGELSRLVREVFKSSIPNDSETRKARRQLAERIMTDPSFTLSAKSSGSA